MPKLSLFQNEFVVCQVFKELTAVRFFEDRTHRNSLTSVDSSKNTQLLLSLSLLETLLKVFPNELIKPNDH